MLAASGGSAGDGRIVSGQWLVSSTTRDAVLRFDHLGAALTPLIEGTAASDDPRSMALGPNGTLYVAACGSDAVVRLDPRDGSPIGDPIRHPALGTASSILLPGDGSLWVATDGGGRVLRFDASSGELLGDAVDPARLVQPRDVLLDGRGHVLVTDSRAHRVRRFSTTDGAWIDDLVTSRVLTGPGWMLLGPTGETLLVSNWFSGTVAEFSLDDGAFVRVVVDDPKLRPAGAIARGPEDDLLVVAPGLGEVRRYDPATGDFRGAIGRGGDAPGPTALLWLPADVAGGGVTGDATSPSR